MMYVSNGDDLEDSNPGYQMEGNLSNTTETCGDEDRCNILVEDFPNIINSQEDIEKFCSTLRAAFEQDDGLSIYLLVLEHTSQMFSQCKDTNSPCCDIIKTFLLDVVLEVLTNYDSRLWKAGQTALLDLIDQGHLSMTVIEDRVCPTVASIRSNISEYSKSHINPVALMLDLGQLLGGDIAVRFFVDKYLDICCNDDNVYLREYGIKSLAEFAIVIGRDETDKRLIPTFKLLCLSEEVVIRKLCAEVFMMVSSACSMSARRLELTPVFLQLLDDRVDLVQFAAYQVLGAFITTFADPPVAGAVYDSIGELIFKGTNGCEFRVPNVQSTPSRQSTSIIGTRCFDGWLVAERSNQGMSVYSHDDYSNRKTDQESKLGRKLISRSLVVEEMNKADEPEENISQEFNTFQFWHLPVPDLESVLDDSNESIDVSLKNIDIELYSISEKLANWPKSDEGTFDDMGSGDNGSVSNVSMPDSGWNSGSNTPTPSSVTLDPTILTSSTVVIDPTRTEHSGEGHIQQKTIILSDHITHHQDIVPQSLLDRFLDMASPAKVTDLDVVLPQHCAFFFPAVVLTLGKENWSCVADLYRALVVDLQWRVRYTVAASLHEVATILGEELTTRDLADVLKELIKDLDEVRVGALEHLAKFLKSVAQPKRDSFLPELKNFLEITGEQKWRFRKLLAEQLELCCELFAPSDCCRYIGPIAIDLLTDRVAAVRKAAISLMCELLCKLHDENEMKEMLVEHLCDELSEQECLWTRRVVFASLCAEVALRRSITCDLFTAKLLAPLLWLVRHDPIPNVRLCVARCLSHGIIASGFLPKENTYYKNVMWVLEEVNRDSDSDVRALAKVPSSDNDKESDSDKDNFW